VLDSLADKVVAVLSSRKLIRTHRAAVDEEVWLRAEIYIMTPAVSALRGQRFDWFVEHAPTIHPIVRRGDFNTAHLRVLDASRTGAILPSALLLRLLDQSFLTHIEPDYVDAVLTKSRDWLGSH